MRFLNFLLILIVLIAAPTVSILSQNSEREYDGYIKNGNEIIIKTNDGLINIIPFNNQIFHITHYPESHEIKNFSYAVDITPDKIPVTINDSENTLTINTSGLSLIITKKPLGLSFYKNNELILSEKEGYFRTDTNQTIQFNLEKEEILYGGGTRVLGMDRRGNRLELYNKAHYGYETHSELMNYTLPMFISSKKYAVLFDNASIGYLDLDSENNNTLEYETVSGTINYYVIASDDWFDLTYQYTWLTGRQPLPPRWSFGSYSSRFGYHSQEEVLNTVEKFMEDNIPVEAAIIDIYWFGPEIFDAMGNLDWYRDSFPEPEKMITQLDEWGVKTILVTEPFILTTSDKWEEAVENKVLATDSIGNPYTYDFYFGNTGLIDIFDPQARDWFWDIYKDFTKQGIGGWWGDLGEPEVHPSGLQHINGSADEVHNVYGHEWLKMIYEGYQKDFPQQRPFILMRSGYAGSQRYGIIPWTGDVSRSWGGLVPQVELSLQMGMQGLAYMHSDLGGFAEGEIIDNELYIRWLQYGVFQPVYRPHAQEHIPSEPVLQNDTTKEHAKRAIELRYKLLPYIYNLAYENSRTGKPLMIPLFFNNPDNIDLLTYDNAYMWGEAFLVSPVKEAGKKKQKVYLPEGTSWINFHSDKVYDGGKETKVPLTISQIPVFVKGGSFIPMLPKAKQTRYYSIDTLIMHYYCDNGVNKSTYDLYNDDGITPGSYEKGKYEILRFTADRIEKMQSFKIIKESGNDYNSGSSNTINWIIHNLTIKPEKIVIEGEEINPAKFDYDLNKKTLSFSILFKDQVSIQVHFKN